MLMLIDLDNDGVDIAAHALVEAGVQVHWTTSKQVLVETSQSPMEICDLLDKTEEDLDLKGLFGSAVVLGGFSAVQICELYSGV